MTLKFLSATENLFPTFQAERLGELHLRHALEKLLQELSARRAIQVFQSFNQQVQKRIFGAQIPMAVGQQLSRLVQVDWFFRVAQGARNQARSFYEVTLNQGSCQHTMGQSYNRT